MTIALILTVLYLCIAAWAYWFILNIPSKSGHRITREDMVRTTRREGLQLSFFALLWLPILGYVTGAAIVNGIKDRIIRP